jgi:hypothetical protein
VFGVRLREALRQDASARAGQAPPLQNPGRVVRQIDGDCMGRIIRVKRLAGGGELALARETGGARFVAVGFAEDFAEAFAGFVDLGF